MKRILNIRDTSDQDRSALRCSMMGPVDHGKELDSFINVMGNHWKFFKKGNDIILFPLEDVSEKNIFKYFW